MKPSLIGICVSVLFYKKWGRTLVDGQLKSKYWWENRLKSLIDIQAIEINKDLLTDWEPRDKPMPYEIEMKFDQ